MPSNRTLGRTTPWLSYMAAAEGRESHLTDLSAEGPLAQLYGPGPPPNKVHGVDGGERGWHGVDERTFADSERGSGWRVRSLERSRYFVSDFTKCALAALTASGPIAHEVFFASIGRAKFARRNARKRFGSTPSSVASALGVTTFAMCVTPFRLIVCIPEGYTRTFERASVETRTSNVRVRLHSIAYNRMGLPCIRSRQRYATYRFRSFARSFQLAIVRSINHCHLQRSTPPTGIRWGISLPRWKTDLEPKLWELF